MKKNTTHKDFHAVEFMRKRRDELSELYSRNPSGFRKELEAARKKYASKFHRKIKKAA
jgi:hypothetical protein